MSLDWLIIGGGIHGVHIGARLLGDAAVEPSRLAIVDPGAKLLARWNTCTATTGMTHLRSPVVHHIDNDPWSLRHYAGKKKKRKPGLFAPPYDRPSLELFNAHCRRVVEQHGLASRHIQAWATDLEVDCDGVRVGTSGAGELEARNVVLAMGAGEQPHWPRWALRNRANVQHVFQPGFDGWPTVPEVVAVVGGGISGCQVAMRLLDAGHEVHLISRHPLREHQFDSHPGWLGPRFMRDFERVGDFDERRRIIAQARYRGSVPGDVRRAIEGAIDRGLLHWHLARVDSLRDYGDQLLLRLSKRSPVPVDRVLLATGFDPRRPGGDMVDKLVADAALPCASCGYPIVDDSLRWHPRVFVSGPLAELRLGPIARNIAGARRAAERLIACDHHAASSRR